MAQLKLIANPNYNPANATLGIGIDSLSANNFQINVGPPATYSTFSNGPVALAQALAKVTLTPKPFGVSGYTMQNWIDDNTGFGLNAFLANPTDFFLLTCGTNDVQLGASFNLSDSRQRLSKIVNAILGKGTYLIVTSIPPVGAVNALASSAVQNNVRAWNKALRDQVLSLFNSTIEFVDLFPALCDTSNTAIPYFSGLNKDSVHTNQLGCALAAPLMATRFAALFQPIQLVESANDSTSVDATSNNIMQNPLMLGTTTGNFDSGTATGRLPTNWRGSGSANVSLACSVISAQLTDLVAGSAYTNGSYTNVAMTGGSGTGMRCDITVDGGIVTSCIYTTTVSSTHQGIDYVVGDVLSANAADIGGTGTGFTITVANRYAVGNKIQMDLGGAGSGTAVVYCNAGTFTLGNTARARGRISYKNAANVIRFGPTIQFTGNFIYGWNASALDANYPRTMPEMVFETIKATPPTASSPQFNMYFQSNGACTGRFELSQVEFRQGV